MASIIRRRALVDDAHLQQVSDAKLRQLYASRGITDASQLERSAKALLHYQNLNGIDKAVEVLSHGIIEQQKIVIVGDFDADGATSTAVSMLALTRLGSRHHSYLVPNRFDFGYGLSREIVDVAHQQHAQIIMTVDNGIACHAGVNRAKELGIKVVITDHHLAAETLPPADAIVNPNQPGCEFLSKHLAGVGVAFYLMLALRTRMRSLNWFEKMQLPEPNFADLLDIVALGTVADVVALDENNRVLVHQGLQRIRSGRCRPGITALIDVAGRSAHSLVATDLGFVLGPRLNAAGRLDDMALGIECLLTEDLAIARRMALELDRLNQERKEIQSSMQQEAMQSLASLQLSTQHVPSALVVYKADFHQGVIGIVAGRIKEQFNRPTIAFAHQDEQTLKGSARSIQGLHIRDVLEEVNSRYPDMISKFGGHAMAAGLTIALSQLDAFKQAFEQVVAEALKEVDLSGTVLSDGELDKQHMNLQFAQLLKDAGPWGQSFPEPLFDGEFELLDQRLLAKKHLKMMLKHASGVLIDAIAFNVQDPHWPKPEVNRVKLAYKLDINEFRGKTQLQLLVDVIEPLNGSTA